MNEEHTTKAASARKSDVRGDYGIRTPGTLQSESHLAMHLHARKILLGNFSEISGPRPTDRRDRWLRSLRFYCVYLPGLRLPLAAS